jgi:hypothetical protein
VPDSTNTNADGITEVDYSEGLLIDYRWFDAVSILLFIPFHMVSYEPSNVTEKYHTPLRIRFRSLLHNI